MRNNKGTTFSEVLVALVIASIIMALVAGEFSSINARFISKRELLEAEGLASKFERLMTQTLGQAYRVDFGTTPSAANLANNPGAIANVNFTKISDLAPWTIIAVFQREVGRATALPPTNVTFSGDIQRSALFFRRPEGAPNTSGVMFFHNPGIFIPGAMSPSWSDDYVDRISYLTITKNKHASFDRTVSVDVVVHIRYYLTSAWGITWCPKLDITGGTAGCVPNAGANYQDVERTFNVVLRNNLLHQKTATYAPGVPINFSTSTGVASEERAMGNLYFFAPIYPQ